MSKQTSGYKKKKTKKTTTKKKRALHTTTKTALINSRTPSQEPAKHWNSEELITYANSDGAAGAHGAAGAASAAGTTYT